MRFKEILHYVEKSYGGTPSFVILMDDNKEYISDGFVWMENTEENINGLIEEYDCEEYIEELLQAPALEIEDLVNGTAMFEGSGLTEWTKPLPKLVDGRWMFAETDITEWAVDLPELVDGTHMFSRTDLTEWTVDLPKLENGFGMFTHTPLETPTDV